MRAPRALAPVRSQFQVVDFRFLILPDITIAFPPSYPTFCPLVARPASMRILAAFLGAACKIRSFEFGRGAAISATVS